MGFTVTTPEVDLKNKAALLEFSHKTAYVAIDTEEEPAFPENPPAPKKEKYKGSPSAMLYQAIWERYCREFDIEERNREEHFQDYYKQQIFEFIRLTNDA